MAKDIKLDYETTSDERLRTWSLVMKLFIFSGILTSLVLFVLLMIYLN